MPGSGPREPRFGTQATSGRLDITGSPFARLQSGNGCPPMCGLPSHDFSYRRSAVLQDYQMENSRDKQLVSVELRATLGGMSEAHTEPPLSPWRGTHPLVQRLRESCRGRAPPRLSALPSRGHFVTAPKHTGGDAGRSDVPRGSREPLPVGGRQNAASTWFGAVCSRGHPRRAWDVSPWVRKTPILGKVTSVNWPEQCFWLPRGGPSGYFIMTGTISVGLVSPEHRKDPSLAAFV